MTSEAFPILKAARPLLQRSAIHYPDSDGEPMAENNAHYYCITETHFALSQFLHDHLPVYVGADLLVYYVESDPTKSVAPDVLVAFNRPPDLRRSFKVWEEGGAPDIIFEFASEGTWRGDLGWKRGLYLGLGVREYFLFDPGGAYFEPLLQGYQLVADNYRALPPLTTGRGVRGLYSDLLSLEIWAIDNDDPQMPYVLRFYDPAQETWLLTPKQADDARRTAEAQVAHLQAELARLRAGAS